MGPGRIVTHDVVGGDNATDIVAGMYDRHTASNVVGGSSSSIRPNTTGGGAQPVVPAAAAEEVDRPALRGAVEQLDSNSMNRSGLLGLPQKEWVYRRLRQPLL